MLELSEVLSLAMLCGGGLFVSIFYKQKIRGRHSFLLLVSTLFIAYVLGLLFFRHVLFDIKFFMIVLYSVNTMAAISLFFFSLQYVGRWYWISFPRNLIFFLEPVFSLVLILIIPRSLFWKDSLVQPKLPPWFWFWDAFHQLYIFSLLGFALLLVVRNISFHIKPLRLPVILFVLAIAFPLFPAFSASKSTLDLFHLQTAAFLASCILLGAAFLKAGGINRLFFSYDYIVESMREGWVLLDTQRHILDVNESAEKLLHLSCDKVCGLDAKVVFARWPIISDALAKGQDFEVKGSFTVQGAINYLHVRILRVEARDGALIGYLISLRDHNERRKLEAARQEARDEMFGLLHSISGAASRSENTDEFIMAAMYQLGYSFRNTSTAIFLKAEDSDEDDHHFLLVAQNGVAADKIRRISFLDDRYQFVANVLGSREPLLVEDPQNDERFPDYLRDIFKGSLLVVPVLADDSFVGLVLMTREEDLFANDEIVRLEIAAQQIGSFVQNDRRRHLASTLAERQRLIRDLHDSVTQRLYGLVMMTEAARLGFAGETIKEPCKLIAQLGFNARQALREMRLFLYKLQPIDIERDGFVSALMRRLDAVEGRSGLEMQLDIDQSLVFLPECAVNLFLIAQEVLNNIIKHANANKVSVRFQKERDNICLEIGDDGSGFDPERLTPSGLGIRNIKERTKLIGGTVTIASSPTQGTKYTILFPENEMIQELLD